MLRIGVGATKPREMDDSKAVWLVSVTKQNVINASSFGELDDRLAVEDMTCRQLALKLGVQNVRLVGVRPIPTVW